ncbi:hypothetical protein NECAME_07925 [Necator americanus]|uniref:Thioredoxin-like fold domain-containing protein n=1 Tax=Necator americanus TaxID=51031 RepID=W2TK77_NECAM|nr:hypothetical protein NECAME_07925 [Necator americanus]ETN82480.1 hypothetical protein NECAME_07925 [Necator americanus]
MAELLSGVKIQLKDGSQVDAGDYLKGKMVGLYFSASWCPPCRTFTPKLKTPLYVEIRDGVVSRAEYDAFYKRVDDEHRRDEIDRDSFFEALDKI